MIDFEYGVKLPPGQGTKSVACNGAIISFHSPINTLPASGEYTVTEGDFDYRPGVVDASFKGPSVGSGLWLFGGTPYVDGYKGTVRLDSMDRKRVWGKFAFVGRRKHGGE